MKIKTECSKWSEGEWVSASGNGRTGNYNDTNLIELKARTGWATGRCRKMLLSFCWQRQRETMKMHSLNFRRVVRLVFTLQVLLIFSHFIPVAYGKSSSSTASTTRSSDAQVVRAHRAQIDVIRRTNHELELKKFTSDNKNFSESNYINPHSEQEYLEKTNQKILVHSPLVSTSKQNILATFLVPSIGARTSSSDIIASKSFLPSKLPPQTATAYLTETNPFTDTTINEAIICDCSISVSPISNDKRQQGASTRCLQVCSRVKQRNRRNAEPFPSTLIKLSSDNSTTPNYTANQRHEWHTSPAAASRTFTGLSFQQLSIVDLFPLCLYTKSKASYDFDRYCLIFNGSPRA